MTKIPASYREVKTKFNTTVQISPSKIKKKIHGQEVFVTICPSKIAKDYEPPQINVNKASTQANAQRNRNKRF